MRRVYSGRFPSIPVYQRISPFSPGKSTINVVRASAVNLRRTPPATDSEPVSLGSNPSSPVLISHAPRGFRHSAAGLPRERGGAFVEAPSVGGQSRPPLVSWRVLSRAEGLSALGCGPVAGASLSASGGATRGARRTTSAPPSWRASSRSPPAPRSGSATAACSRGNRCRSSSRRIR
jgi:hypothetical protein